MTFTLGKVKTVVACVDEAHPFRGIALGYNDDGSLGLLDVLVPVKCDDGSVEVATLSLLGETSPTQRKSISGVIASWEALVHERFHGLGRAGNGLDPEGSNL